MSDIISEYPIIPSNAMLVKRTNAKRHIKPKVDSEQDLEVNFDDLDVGFYEGQNGRYRYNCS